MRTAIACFALALAFAPHMAVAAPHDSVPGAPMDEAQGGNRTIGFLLTAVARTGELVVAGPSRTTFAPEPRSSRDAQAARFADGVVQYIEGPAWDYRMSRHGPLFEVGALGGGMENAPYLAHVAMNWRF